MNNLFGVFRGQESSSLSTKTGDKVLSKITENNSEMTVYSLAVGKRLFTTLHTIQWTCLLLRFDRKVDMGFFGTFGGRFRPLRATDFNNNMPPPEFYKVGR